MNPAKALINIHCPGKGGDLMYFNKIDCRLTEIEKKYCKNPMICLCVDKNGIEHQLPVRQAIDEGYGFVRFCGGNNFDDLDYFLQHIKSRAEKKYNKMNNKQ